MCINIALTSVLFTNIGVGSRGDGVGNRREDVRGGEVEYVVVVKRGLLILEVCGETVFPESGWRSGCTTTIPLN